MKSYVLSPLAEEDLLDIWSYIAIDNIVAADAVLLKIRDELRKLLLHPNLGHHRDDFPAPELRAWLVYSYVVVYRPAGEELQVVRIIHGNRDIPNILSASE